MSNAAQAEMWNGPIGQRWASGQAQITDALREMTDSFLSNLPVQGGERVVDVGCGAGDLTLAMASLVGPCGHVLGVDVSAPLLAVARERVAGLPRGSAPVELLHADAASLELAADRDLIVSRFGVMFFDDPVAAFRQLRQALNIHGRLALLTWRSMAENEWARIPFETVSRLIEDGDAAFPFDGPGPFAFADAERVTDILTEAGFDEVTAAPIEARVFLGRDLDEAGIYAASLTPGARMLLDEHEELRANAIAQLTEQLRPFLTPDGVRLAAACWVYEARNPG